MVQGLKPHFEAKRYHTFPLVDIFATARRNRNAAKKKMKNNTIRLYGLFILFGAVMFYLLFATVGSLLSDFKDAAEVLKKSF